MKVFVEWVLPLFALALSISSLIFSIWVNRQVKRSSRSGDVKL